MSGAWAWTQVYYNGKIKEVRWDWNLALTLSPTPAGLVVYFGYGIWHSKENQREPLELTTAHYVVFPSGSLEETVQAVQPSSQSPVQESGCTE